MYRLLVTGPRDLQGAEVIWLPLWMLVHAKKSIIVEHGACPTGADLYAHEWIELPGQPWNREHRNYEPKEQCLALEDPHPANWGKYGKAAGPIRNQEMVDVDPTPDACFAWPSPDCRGTLDCMARSWVKGIPVYIWHYLEPGRYRLMGEEEGEQLARRRLGWGTTHG